MFTIRDSEVKPIRLSISFDGWFTICHIVIPNEKWFERELKKAYEQGIKVHLVVEVADMYSKILSSRYFRHDKASKVTPASFEAMFQALMTRYNVSVWPTDKKDSARLIHNILYYGAREYLKGVEQDLKSKF